METKIVALDPSLRNFGVAEISYNGSPKIENLTLITTEVDNTLSRGDDDLRCARHIVSELMPIVKDADIVVAELPRGSQSSRAAWTLGIVVGILATIPEVVPVTAREVKSVTGKKKVSKRTMIKWATKKHPDANWLYYRGRLVNANEHLADAVGAFYAALDSGKLNKWI